MVQFFRKFFANRCQLDLEWWISCLATDSTQHFDITQNDVIRYCVCSVVSIPRIKSFVLRMSNIWRSTCSRMSDIDGNTNVLVDWTSSFSAVVGLMRSMPAITLSHGRPVNIHANNGYRSPLIPNLLVCRRIPLRSTFNILNQSFEYWYRNSSVKFWKQKYRNGIHFYFIYLATIVRYFCIQHTA